MLNKSMEELKEKYRSEIDSIMAHFDCVISFMNAQTVVKVLQADKELLDNAFHKKMCVDLIKIIQGKINDNKAFIFDKEQDGIDNEEFRTSLVNVLEILLANNAKLFKKPTSDTNFLRQRVDTMQTIEQLLYIL